MHRVVGVSALVLCACVVVGCGSSRHVAIGGPPRTFVEPTWLRKIIARETTLLHYPHPHSMQFKFGKQRDVVVLFGEFKTPAPAACTTSYCPVPVRLRGTSLRLVVSPRNHRLLSISLGQRIASPQALRIARRSSRFFRIFGPSPGTIACSIPHGGPPGGSDHLRGRCTTAFVSSPPYRRDAIRVGFVERWRWHGRTHHGGWIVTVRQRDGRVLGSRRTGATAPQLWAIQ